MMSKHNNKSKQLSDDTIQLTIDSNVSKIKDDLEKAGAPHVNVDMNVDLKHGSIARTQVYKDPIEIQIDKKYVKKCLRHNTINGLYKVLAPLNHESQHVFQEIEHKSLDFESDYLLHRLATYNNPCLYNLNYYENINELDAEINGIIKGRKVICKLTDENTANDVALDYINDKMTKPYFKEQSCAIKFDTFDQAMDFMYSYIGVCLDHKFTYDNYNSKQSPYRKEDDEFYQALQLLDKNSDIPNYFSDAFEKADAETALRMQASITLTIHPELQERYHYFIESEGGNLMPEVLFGKEFSVSDIELQKLNKNISDNNYMLEHREIPDIGYEDDIDEDDFDY